jgi:hypothetical protein
MNPIHRCPTCLTPLVFFDCQDNGVQLYCGFGPCESERANAGTRGVTLRDAFERLEDAVLCELGERDEQRERDRAKEEENFEWKRRVREGSRYAT